MSFGCEDASMWAAWAAIHELPQETINVATEHEEVEQGWPPGMMDEESLRILHDMGTKNTRFNENRSVIHHLLPFFTSLCRTPASCSSTPSNCPGTISCHYTAMCGPTAWPRPH
jgi:hypothetical protein